VVALQISEDKWIDICLVDLKHAGCGGTWWLRIKNEAYQQAEGRQELFEKDLKPK